MPDNDSPISVDESAAASRLAELLAAEAPAEDEPVDEPEDTPEEPEAEEVADEQPEADAPPAPEPTSDDEEFIPRADLESLLEGVEDEQARERIVDAYKSFQRGFTKRTQELSGLRRAFEGVDPVEAKEAYEFVQALQSDRDFALQIHEQLSTALEQAGLTPRQAEAEATRQIQDATATASTDWEKFGVEADNPFVQELEGLKAWKAEQEEAEKERQFEERRQSAIRDIERADAAIKQANPSYDEDDMGTIYKLAASTQGDLFEAQEIYEALQDRIVTEYVAKKSKIPAGARSVSSGPSHSEKPVVINNTDEAHAIAKQMIGELIANQED